MRRAATVSRKGADEEDMLGDVDLVVKGRVRREGRRGFILVVLVVNSGVTLLRRNDAICE